MGLVLAFAAVVPGCSGSAPAAGPAGTSGPATIVGSAPDGQPSTSAAPVFDPSSLEGPIAFESFGCGTSLDPGALAGVDSVEEAMATVGQSGFDGTAVVCTTDPDGANLRQVSAPGHESRYPGFTDDGASLYWYDVTDESWMVARSDGADPRPWESTTDFPWRRSPDGALYVNTSWGEPGFFVTKTGEKPSGPSRRHLVATADACCDTFRWSPDGESILFYSTAASADCPRLMKVDVATGVQTALTGKGSVSEEVPICVEFDSARWSPDGSSILFHDYQGVRSSTTPYLVEPDGGNLRPLLPEGMLADPDWMATASAWSPDGSAIVVGIVDSSSQGAYLVPLDGQGPVRIGGDEAIALATATQFAWAPAPPTL